MTFNIDPRWLKAAARMTPLRTLADIVAATEELKRNSRARPLLSTVPAAFATKPARPAAQSARPAAPQPERRQPQPQTRPRSGSSPRPAPPPPVDQVRVQPDPFGRRYSLLAGTTGLDGPRREPLEVPLDAKRIPSLDGLLENPQLGALSRQWETGNRGPGVVSTGFLASGARDSGGQSYGQYQLSSRWKRPQDFLRSEGLPWAERFASLEPGTEGFNRVWRNVAAEDPAGFAKAQHDYIRRTHYDPQVAKLRKEAQLDVLLRSYALQDVVWSTAVQHGDRDPSLVRAVQRLGPRAHDPRYEEDLIRQIYIERTRDNPRDAARYRRESEAAIQMYRRSGN